jgi:hypothetical protein
MVEPSTSIHTTRTILETWPLSRLKICPGAIVACLNERPDQVSSKLHDVGMLSGILKHQRLLSCRRRAPESTKRQNKPQSKD